MPKKITAILLVIFLSGGLIYGGNKIIKKFLQPEKDTEEFTQKIKEEKISLPIQTPEILGEQIEKRLQEIQSGRVWQRNFSVLSPVNKNWSVMIGQTRSDPKFKLQIQGSVGPSENNQFNLGSSENQWANLYSQNIFQNGQQVVSNVNASGGIIASILGNTLNLGANFASGGCVGIDSTGNIKILDNCLDFDKFKDKMSLDADTDINLNEADLTLSVEGKAVHNISSEGNVFFDEPDSTFFIDSQNNRVGIGTLNPSYPLDVEGDIRSQRQMIASRFSDLDDLSFFIDPAGASYLNQLQISTIYDKNNPSYYLVPASSSFLNTLDVNIAYANIYYDKSDNRYFVTPAGTSKLTNLILDGSLILNGSLNSNLTVAGNVTAASFYDSDDPTYFINPAASSYLNNLYVSSVYDFDNNSFYLNPDSTSRFNNLIVLNDLTADQILSSGAILYLNNNVLTINKSSKRVGVNTLSPAYDFEVSGQAYFSTRAISPLFADADDSSYFVDPDSVSYLNNLRTSILYDNDDSAYYLDPADTSNLFNVGIVGDLSVEDNSIVFASPAGVDFGTVSNFSINTNQFFVEKTTGNVGVNTTSPTEKLTVQGDIKGTDGSKTKYMLMGGDTASTGGQLKLYDASGTLQIWLRTTGNSYVNFGSFGVATKSPSQTFQVGKAGDGTSAVANAWNTFSDIRFKENIKTIQDPLDKVLALDGVYFNWKTTGERSIGFIAQQVQQVLPEIVKTDSQGYLSVSYSKLTPVLVEAVKVQQGLIKENTLRIDNLDLNVFGEVQKVKLDIETLSQKKPESQLKQKNQNALLNIFDIKDKIVQIVKQIVFKAQAVFKQQVKFLSKVVFAGRIEYQDKDLAGYARISRGSTEVKIFFENPFSFTPVVTASALNTPVQFFLKDITPSGFTIAINSSADRNYDFSWAAIPVRNARRFISPEKTPDYSDNPIPSENNQKEFLTDNSNQNSSSVQENRSQQQTFPAKDYQNHLPLPTPPAKNNQTADPSSTQSNENNKNQKAFYPALTVSPVPASDKHKNQSEQSFQPASESKTEYESSPSANL